MADFSIPTLPQITPPQQMSLGDMVNTARAAQAYQQAAQVNPLDLQAKQMAIDLAQKTNPLTVRQAIAAAGTAETGEKSSALDFANKTTVAVANRLTPLINNPLVIAAERNPSAVNSDELAKIIKNYGVEQATALGIPTDKADQLIQPYLDQTKNPAGLRQFLKEKLLSTMDAGARATTVQPTGVGVTTGARGGTISTSEFGQYPQGQVLPGTAYTQELPPGTEAVATPGDGTGLPAGTKYKIGSQPMGNRPLITGLGPGAETGLTNITGAVTSHYTGLSSANQKAEPDIAILQNIKKYANEAFTGVGGARKSLAAGIANAIGISAYEAEKTSTDLLAKNAAMLQLAGGNTDLAMTLAGAANPNSKMNLDAIQSASNQLIGQRRLVQAQHKVLAPLVNNPDNYYAKLQEVTQASNPLLFQESTPEEVKKLRASMTPDAQAQFSTQIKMARQLGMLK
jgi:hypothetical protein